MRSLGCFMRPAELDDDDHTHEDGVAVLIDLKPGQCQCVERSDFRTVKVRVDEKYVNEIRKWERLRGAMVGGLIGFVIAVLGYFLGRLL